MKIKRHGEAVVRHWILRTGEDAHKGQATQDTTFKKGNINKIIQAVNYVKLTTLIDMFTFFS